MNWYVLHIYSGFEGKIIEALNELREKFEGRIGEILTPKENIVEMKKGKKQVRERTMLPGYLFVQLKPNRELWREIRNIPQVTDFLGQDKKPRPIPASEMEHLLGHARGEVKHTVKETFSKGENVRVIEGPFVNFTGIVEVVNPEKGKLKVMVSILGRSTPVELEFQQVEKL